MKRHRLTELWVDPQSGEFSASRACLCLVVGVLTPVGIALRAMTGIDILGHLTTLAGIMAGVYGVNSAARVWKGEGQAGGD